MAMGVFGIAVIGMMLALNGALDAARAARLDQFVRTEMDSRLAQLEALAPRELTRTVELDSPRITMVESVHREEVKKSDSTVLSGFWRVSVQARWHLGVENREETASFLVYAP